MSSERYLYRGVNAVLFAQAHRGLEPKAPARAFCRPVYFGEGVCFGDETTFGESEANAVLMHQRDSSKYPTAGVSTTPSFENAKAYATHQGRHERGYVFKIDTALLEAAGVRAYNVSDYTSQPAIPGDREVLLFSREPRRFARFRDC